MAICCVSKKIQTAYVCLNTLRALDFFASLHLTIFERPASFEFFSQLEAWPDDPVPQAHCFRKSIHIIGVPNAHQTASFVL
jgi:hypothetical protein